MIANKLFDKYIEKMEAKVGNSLYLATVFDMYMYAYIYMYHNYGQIFFLEKTFRLFASSSQG